MKETQRQINVYIHTTIAHMMKEWMFKHWCEMKIIPWSKLGIYIHAYRIYHAIWFILHASYTSTNEGGFLLWLDPVIHLTFAVIFALHLFFCIWFFAWVCCLFVAFTLNLILCHFDSMSVQTMHTHTHTHSIRHNLMWLFVVSTSLARACVCLLKWEIFTRIA